VAFQGSKPNYDNSWLFKPTGIGTLCSPCSQNTAERQEDVTTLTQDVRDAAGCLEGYKQDQNLALTHKRAQNAMAVTLLMNKIVQNLA